jgi:hypothetical protein
MKEYPRHEASAAGPVNATRVKGADLQAAARAS